MKHKQDQRGRAWRRHHRRRMEQRARAKLNITLARSAYRDEIVDRLACRMADNLKSCSCAACTTHWPSHRQDVDDFSAQEQVQEASKIDTPET